MQRHAFVQQLAQPALEISGAVLPVDLVVHVPIAPDFDPAVFRDQIMAGQQLMDVLEQRLFADRVLKRQIFGQRLRIGIDISARNGSSAFTSEAKVKNAANAAHSKTA